MRGTGSRCSSSSSTSMSVSASSSSNRLTSRLDRCSGEHRSGMVGDERISWLPCRKAAWEIGVEEVESFVTKESFRFLPRGVSKAVISFLVLLSTTGWALRLFKLEPESTLRAALEVLILAAAAFRGRGVKKRVNRRGVIGGGFLSLLLCIVFSFCSSRVGAGIFAALACLVGVRSISEKVT